MQPDKDPGPIGTEEVAHVPEWLEVSFWSLAFFVIMALVVLRMVTL